MTNKKAIKDILNRKPHIKVIQKNKDYYFIETNDDNKMFTSTKIDNILNIELSASDVCCLNQNLVSKTIYQKIKEYMFINGNDYILYPKQLSNILAKAIAESGAVVFKEGNK